MVFVRQRDISAPQHELFDYFVVVSAIYLSKIFSVIVATVLKLVVLGIFWHYLDILWYPK